MSSLPVVDFNGLTAHLRIPYRGGRVYARFLVIGQSLAAEALHEDLAKQIGKVPDNHTTYFVEDDDGNRYGIFFSDGRAYFGIPASDEQLTWDHALETSGLLPEEIVKWTDPQ